MAAAPSPHFIRAPGLGLALVDTASGVARRGYDLSGDAEARTMASEFARRVTGHDGASPGRSSHPLVAELFEDWLEAGGTPHRFAPAGKRSGSVRQVFERVVGDLADPHGANAPPDWSVIRSNLASSGLRLRRRGDFNDSHILGALRDFTVFEITDLNDKVVAEGKASDASGALASVLGECVERIVAQSPNKEALRCETAEALRRDGVPTPHFVAEVGDLFSADLLVDWIAARSFDGVEGAMPAELAYYPFVPRTGVRAFSTQHTSGLAAATTQNAAALAGLRESIETDAYWLSMRAKRVCGRFDDLENAAQPAIRSLVRNLSDAGIVVWAGSISFDWPLAVVHVVLQTTGESLPTLAHGLGSGETWIQATERALSEAIQVYSGLEKIALQYWQEIAVRPDKSASAAVHWSSRKFAPRVTEVFADAPILGLDSAVPGLLTNVSDLLAWMVPRGLKPWSSCLGEMQGLVVARVYLEGGVSAFSERAGPSKRVMSFTSGLGLRYPYMDPILT